MERYVATQFYKADSPESRILRESGIAPSEFVLAADAQATIAALQERVQELEAIKTPDDAFTYCAYCGEKSPVDEHNEDLAAHIKVCPKHPMRDVESQLTQRTAEFQRHDGELQQICGQALGYPWFKDDQKNFPGATEKDGVCVGEHVGITIVQELANAHRERTEELEAAKAECSELREHKKDAIHYLRRALQEADIRVAAEGEIAVSKVKDLALKVNTLHAELERVRGERDEANELVAALSSKVAEYEVELNGDPQNFYGKGRTVGLRTLILALPKVEGEIEVKAKRREGAEWWSVAVDGWLCEYSPQFDDREQAEAYAALFKHRQGMEG